MWLFMLASMSENIKLAEFKADEDTFLIFCKARQTVPSILPIPFP